MSRASRKAYAGFAVWAMATCALCPPPARAQIPFTEEAAPRGIRYVTTHDNYGVGVCFNDLDNDGDADVVLIGATDNRVGIYENVDGLFVDRSTGSGIPGVSAASGIVAADYDGDGLLDLYITRWLAANTLLRNLGGLTFANVTTAAGVGDAGPANAACFGDYDGDGWLDLYVANYTNTPGGVGMGNRLYRNLGNGAFAEVGAALGVDSMGYGFQPIFFDYDLDGDVDIYCSNDRAHMNLMIPNQLWRNDNGSFVDVSASSGADSAGFYMGVACGDVDRNGWPDLYSTNIASVPNTLLLNQGDGTFLESAPDWDVASFRTGWGALFLDYDNDRHDDLYVCNQYAGPATSPNNRMYRNTGRRPCVDLATPLGVDLAGDSYGVAMADLENDGDLDLLVQSWNEPIRLYVNHEGQERNWLAIRLVGRPPNTRGVGATIRVFADGVTQLRQILAGVGYKSSSTYVAHVGLDTVGVVDKVEVAWPGGVEITELTFVGVNQLLVIEQCPWAVRGDFDGDESVMSGDLPPFVLALLDGQEDCRADVNFDGVADGLDVPAFLAAAMASQ